MERKELLPMRKLLLAFFITLHWSNVICGGKTRHRRAANQTHVIKRGSCDPPCLNDGSCIGGNECHCPTPFYGYRCSYTGYPGNVLTPIKSNTFQEIRMCSMFGPGNIITFDGLFFDFPGKCQYEMTLLGEPDIKVLVRKNGNCTSRSRYLYEYAPCNTGVTIHVASSNSKVFISPSFFTLNGEPITLPYDEHHMMLTRIFPYVVFTIGDVTVRYDVHSGSVHVIISSNRYNDKATGLCGNLNGITTDDLKTKDGFSMAAPMTSHLLEKTWIVEDTDETCKDNVILLKNNMECIQSAEVTQICNILLDSFSRCHSHVNPASFFDLCKTELCRCNYTARQNCHCDVITMYSRYCAVSGGTPPEWRSGAECQVRCPFSYQWKECGVASSPSCSMPYLLRSQRCFDRCQCPTDLYEHKWGCTELQTCPCVHKGIEYKRGQTTSIYNCNKCVCDSGQWECQSSMCPGVAHIHGFDHFKTFDGRFYTFVGECQYIFAKDCAENDFSIYTENSECGADVGVNCRKSFTIRLTDKEKQQNITFHQGSIKVNMYEVQLPFQSGDAHIYRESSIYTTLYQSDLGLVVVWDGHGTIYVTVPQKYRSKMCGLAGDFNGNAADDYKTLEGVTESTALSFRNVWKLDTDCFDVDAEIIDPCKINHEKEQLAVELCDLLYGFRFSDCRDEVDVSPFHRTCMYEVCACTKKSPLECLCDVLTLYAYKCALQGIHLDWRSEHLCNVECKEGQEYQICGSGCGKSCKSLSVPERCTKRCVEGCNCRDGYYLNVLGVCVTAEECACYRFGNWYKPGETIHASSQMCQCVRGRLVCESVGTFPTACPFGQVYHNCSFPEIMYMEKIFGRCARSCQNRHLPCPRAFCTSGCRCPNEYVWHHDRCILPEKCPCYHNSKNYKSGEVIKIECNECTCEESRWQCTNFLCDGECSVTGQSHFKTFDQKWFDFTGNCEYILTTDECGSKPGSFKVTVQSNACESLGYVCHRIVTISLGNENVRQIVLKSGDQSSEIETLEETTGKHIPYQISKHGFFIVVTTGIGLTLFWDEKTRIYVQIDSSYYGKVCGLCGNYDGDENNDFTLRSREVVVNNVVFGNNWRLRDSCPKSSSNITGSQCDLYPERQSWAIHRCGIIKSNVFKECRTQVEHFKYLEHCMTDTCGCDRGGDCDCFCTAIAAYAYACSQHGVFVRWRSHSICPTMCEDYNKNDTCEWHYDECGTSCPNTCCFRDQACPLPCLEGCHPKCKDAHVFSDELQICIPEKDCGPCVTQSSIFTTTPFKSPSFNTTTAATSLVSTLSGTNATHMPTLCLEHCVDANNVSRSVNERWNEGECVTMVCIADDEPGCLHVRVLVNKTELCPLPPSDLCTKYEEAYEVKYENNMSDPNPCCPEVECRCNPLILNVTCPQWYDRMRCSEYETVSKGDFFHDSSQCCPILTCESLLCLDPGGRPFTDEIYYEYDGQCCKRICEDNEATDLCFQLTCNYRCQESDRFPMISNQIQNKTCCKAFTCECDERLCAMKTCPPGQAPILTTKADGNNQCCDAYECESVDCIVRGDIFLPNKTWVDGCKLYKCIYDDKLRSYHEVVIGGAPCPDTVSCMDERYVRMQNYSSTDPCCPRYYCDCQYGFADNALRKVGYEYPDPDDPLCSILRVVKLREDFCPKPISFPLKECPTNPQCGPCELEVPLDAHCCPGRFMCVKKTCPAVPTCGPDQSLIIEAENECCKIFKCLCHCSSLGTLLLTAYHCRTEMDVSGNCTYLASKETGSDVYKVSLKQGHCRDVYPHRTIRHNRMCIEEMNVFYYQQVFVISGKTGAVTLNGRPITKYSQAGVDLLINNEDIGEKTHVTHVTLHLAPIDLTVTYSNPNVVRENDTIGFFDLYVRPSATGTTGICGNCRIGGYSEDECKDLPLLNQSDFALDPSCPLTCGLENTCDEDRCDGISPCIPCHDCVNYKHHNPCTVLKKDVFAECQKHRTLKQIISLCDKSQCFKSSEVSSTISLQCSPCTFSFIHQHIASCRSKGFCGDYLNALNCKEEQIACPGNQVRNKCIDSCITERTCRDVLRADHPTFGQCGVHYMERCTCASGYVLREPNGSLCVKEKCCCNEPPVCSETNSNFEPVVVDMDECGCAIYSNACVCAGCIFKGKKFKPNEKWRDECDSYTCQPNSSDECFDVILNDDLKCEEPPVCSGRDSVLSEIPPLPGGCCSTYSCECKYAIVEGKTYQVGDVFPDPSNPLCGKLLIISVNLTACPISTPLPVDPCEDPPICDACQKKIVLHYDECCGKVYRCVDEPCVSVDSCGSDQKRVLVSKTDCCRAYQCFCECAGLGTPTVTTFQCEHTVSFSSGCSYIITKGIGASVYQVSAENVHCKELVSSGGFSETQMCLKEMLIRYRDEVFKINSVDGTVSWNGELVKRLDGEDVSLTIEEGKFPADSTLSPHVTSATLSIAEIGLTVYYYNPLSGNHSTATGVFKIDLSSNLNQRGTEGVCGNCSLGGTKHSECENLQIPLAETFADNGSCALACGLGETCEENRCKGEPPCVTCRDCTDLGYPNPCLVLNNPIFQKCQEETTLHDVMYLCHKSQCFKSSEVSSTISLQCSPCTSTFIHQHIASCRSKGFCGDYLNALNCKEDQLDCPGIQIRVACVDACLVKRTCDDVISETTRTLGPCGVSYTDECLCPPGYVLKRDGSEECINMTCCSCPLPPPCDDGSPQRAMEDETDSCNCPVYSGGCQCSSTCSHPETNESMYPGDTADSLDGCGEYLCPPDEFFAECRLLQTVYQRKPCLYHTKCEHPYVPSYVSTEGVCCPKQVCVCPKVVITACDSLYEVLETSEGKCETPYCVCRCPSIGVSCSQTPGCKVHATEFSSDNCKCPLKWECISKSQDCPSPPICSACEELLATSKSTSSGIGECRNNCIVYKCRRKTCPHTLELSLRCSGNQQKVTRYHSHDTNNCCPIEKCECLPSDLLKMRCPEFNFKCDADYFKVVSHSGKNCCPKLSCECNPSACPPPPTCGLHSLVKSFSEPSTTGTYKATCCSSYKCICDKRSCPLKPARCPKHTFLKETKQASSCCMDYSCVCDSIPAQYSLPAVRPNANNMCVLPGQKPVPVKDSSGCFAACECYPDDDLLDHCAEYKIMKRLCQSPRIIIHQTVPAHEVDHVCCPKVQCICPSCGSNYETKESLLAKLQPGEVVVQTGNASECCQMYKVICDPDADKSSHCLHYKPACDVGYKLQRNASDFECCPQFHCRCDEDQCDPPPDCVPPKSLILNGKRKGCCKEYICSCPQKTNIDLVCTFPKVRQHRTSACPSTYCACPDSCPVFPIKDCIAKPGCKAIPKARDVCGCVVDVTCVSDPVFCEKPRRCPPCYSSVEVSATSPVGQCNSTCPGYECKRDICQDHRPGPPLCLWNALVFNNSEVCCPLKFPICVPSKCPVVSCRRGYIKIEVEDQYFDDDLNCFTALQCCKKERCVCEVCQFGDQQYAVGATWVASSCETFTCINRRRQDDGCYTVTPVSSTCEYRDDNGTLVELVVGAYIQDQNNPCMSKRCKKRQVGPFCFSILTTTIESCPPVLTCSEYQTLNVTYTEGVCCPVQRCICKPCGKDRNRFPLQVITEYEVTENNCVTKNASNTCCFMTSHKCVGNDVLTKICSEWNKTCGMSKEGNVISSEKECCPKYICARKPCATQPTLTTSHPCYKTKSENPFQEFCPETKLVCSEDMSCCGSDYVTYQTLNSSLQLGERLIKVKSSHKCCPMYQVACIRSEELRSACFLYDTSCKAGYRKVRRLTDTGCCPVYNCACDRSLCPTRSPTCKVEEETFEITPQSETSDCCPRYGCRCKPMSELKGVCKVNNFTCGLHERRVRINPIWECCAIYECKCFACATDSGIYPVGTSWCDVDDHCFINECVQENYDECPSVSKKEKYQCEHIDEQECFAEGGGLTANISTDGCCKSCKSCSVTDNYKVVHFTSHRTSATCSSREKINVPLCSGACATSSTFNVKTKSFDSICRCCQAVTVKEKQYQIDCSDGSSETLKVDHVTKCKCDVTPCVMKP